MLKPFLETVVLCLIPGLLVPLWAWALERAARGTIGSIGEGGPCNRRPAPRMLWINPRDARAKQADPN
jgi:hypothetical protein